MVLLIAFVYSACANKTRSFILKDTISIKWTVDTFNLFLHFSGLKSNLANFEIAEIGFLERVQMAICDMCCTNLNINTLKVLDIHFFCNEKWLSKAYFELTWTRKGSHLNNREIPKHLVKQDCKTFIVFSNPRKSRLLDAFCKWIFLW